MSYLSISIREVLEKINAPTNGWYLPQVQRQFVWGARHESETYICLLLDSLLRKYPIGGIVLWETDQEVPYRKFIDDYTPEKFVKQVDKGLWKANKSLVYDGQQRLQTLYSVLRHQFNDRVLHYDLLFNQDVAENDETGFLFKNSTELTSSLLIRMTELSCIQDDEKDYIELEDKILESVKTSDEKLLVRRNLKNLWKVFVETNHKSIAYFSVKANSPKEVNEVFRRLNTGGIALTQLELVLGKIKVKYSDYEEKLWEVSNQIYRQSNNGIRISSSSILQILHFIIKGTIRIDEDRIKESDIDDFQKLIQEQEIQSLLELFKNFFWERFHINDVSIIPRWLAIIPLAVYLLYRKKCSHTWQIKKLTNDELMKINHYFLLSQFCDWNTQTMVNSFATIAKESAEKGESFPIEKIKNIAVEKNRNNELHEYQLLGLRWFSLKILMPERVFVFTESKPQIDHIFPIKLDEYRYLEEYQHNVDILWNLQPTTAEVNNFKRAKHPKIFFESSEGKKYLNSYDFIPLLDDELWNNWQQFILYRKGEMQQKLITLYDINLIKSSK